MGENVFIMKDLFLALTIKDLEESILKLPFLKMGAHFL